MKGGARRIAAGYGAKMVSGGEITKGTIMETVLSSVPQERERKLVFGLIGGDGQDPIGCKRRLRG